MLSKAAARTFFVVVTGACAIAFIGLTIDTFQRIPAQTRAQDISASVVRGKELWESSNCMGCHTLFGEGGYYAPELTRVMERRGPDFVRAMLRDPQAMYPGQRQMQNYHFEPEQIEDLVSFLTWAGTVDLNDFPPRPTLMPVSVPASNGGQGVARSDDRPQVFNQLCVACHSLDGQGGAVGPALDGVGDRYDADYLKRWIRDPSAVKPGARMPKLPLTEEQILELSAYLSHQKKAPAPANGHAPTSNKETHP